MNYVQTLQEQVNGMVRGVVAALPNIAVALIVLAITWIVARFAVRIADRLTGRTHLRPSLQNLVETLVRLAIWLVGFMIAMTIMLPGLDPAGLVAGLGVGALAVGFAFQDIFENFLAGVLIMLREKMRMGDIIEVEGVLGRVEHITLRETHIRQLSNELTIMPNSMIFKNAVKILTDAEMRRDELIVGVSYDSDLEQSEAVIRKAFEGIEGIITDKPILIFAREFNSSSIDFQVQWWSESKPRDMREVKHHVVMAIKRGLDDAGIEIPFPYVTNTFKEPLSLHRADNDTAA
ncbi:mechanosensitive ion channel family protein [Croceicoccus sp. YJ47]|uniref:mechanosensitive ion channel family protein n=1 Tax=Croceicoccus sp. YJ47 TaxID=2798724 RepID=UPI0019210CBB|nr:mechanosensitive ion channel [Croceicoccus sp. YJ47]QQN73440.1 mechanosensitive ion channel [Croceicoccus sp. YJ47]